MLVTLPQEITVDLSPHGLAGVRALVRPWGIEDKAQYADDLHQYGPVRAKVRSVKRSIVALDGIQVEEVQDGAVRVVRFDPSNSAHLDQIPKEVVQPIFDALLSRISLTEEQEKNSDSPSGSGGTGSSAGSPAGAAPAPAPTASGTPSSVP